MTFIRLQNVTGVAVSEVSDETKKTECSGKESRRTSRDQGPNEQSVVA